MARVLLINPSYTLSYGGAKASIVNPIHPTLGLATIAATARNRGHEVQILDLSWRVYDHRAVQQRLESFRPEIVGITATTALMNQLRDMSVLIKDLAPGTRVVAGGAHPSAMPFETIMETRCDAVFVGEADLSFADYCDGSRLEDIPGLCFRQGDRVCITPRPPPIGDLDTLPMPAWDLYPVEDYRRMSRLLARCPPVTMAEFSRGCVFTCDFCASKITMAKGYRKKSPERCAAEVKHMHDLGFREFMLADDIFTSDQKWARAVCEAIIATGVDMAWTCTNGIRVESADEDLFRIMRRAGCYRVSFGFESGNNEVLAQFGKGGRASIEQGKAAVTMARRAGIDTNGFFLLGLSPDTEQTMRETIDFARQIPVDMMKFGLSIAFPGTKMFDDYVSDGLVKSYDWDEYFIYTDKNLFVHRHLSSDAIKKYLDIAYRKCILQNPGFIFRRIVRGVRTGEFFWDLYYALNFFFMPSVGKALASVYYARDRWPVWNYQANPPRPASYPVVHKSVAAIMADPGIEEVEW
ncbi:radical SAM protein [Paramagnetospirillum kuznetsovii]|uniref:Radical SAM protein n=2 Tax=Paramagnetospirillum kuznetsovii TaxID=2053833 RepID=A0A364NXM0_9PROT|nr:radical SAM protein [Paramagnetospirillum kuznetsovii]